MGWGPGSRKLINQSLLPGWRRTSPGDGHYELPLLKEANGFAPTLIQSTEARDARLLRMLRDGGHQPCQPC